MTAQNKLLFDFLQSLLTQTEREQSELDKKVRLIKNDMSVVTSILTSIQSTCPKIEDVEKHFEKDPQEVAGNETGQLSAIRDEMKQLITDIGSSVPNSEISDKPSTSAFTQSSTYKVRKQKMFHHFDDFVKCYFQSRVEDLIFQADQEQELMITDNNDTPAATPTEPQVPKISKTLDTFRENLVKFSKYSQLRALSTLNYSNDNLQSSTIVSSIEFDKDNEFFAIAGVTKRIKIFDYYTCVRDGVVSQASYHPINEMVCNSKISCVAWNSYFKELLACSDYEGIVTVYDVETRQRKRTFQEHDKRAWSVDFNEIDTKLLASGSGEFIGMVHHKMDFPTSNIYF